MPNEEFSDSGAPILRHQVPTEPIGVSTGNEDLIRQIDAHITRHLGQTSWVIHEVVSPLVHVDIHIVAPSAERPFYVLVTSGMSERAMKVPPGAEKLKYAELVLCLPATISLSEAATLNEDQLWPVRVLAKLAHMPHMFSTWLCAGHTVPNGDPPAPYSPFTRLCCALLGPIRTLPDAFTCLRLENGDVVLFYGVYFIHRAEMDLKLKQDAAVLFAAFRKAGVNELLDYNRRDLAAPFRERLESDEFSMSVAGRAACLKVSTWRLIRRHWVETAFLLLFGRRPLRRFREHYEHGNTLGGIVIQLKPCLVATLANLGQDSDHSFYAVKVSYDSLKTGDVPDLQVGTRVAMVATYSRASTLHPELSPGTWGDVDPRAAACVTNDQAELDRLLGLITEREWQMLEEAIRIKIPRPFAYGLYPLEPARRPPLLPPSLPPPLPSVT